jgi:uncharacterized membrane protein
MVSARNAVGDRIRRLVGLLDESGRLKLRSFTDYWDSARIGPQPCGWNESCLAHSMTFSRAAPLHPVLVHFTIGLVGASFGFDILGLVTKVSSVAAAAWWTIAAAVPVTVVTAITGLISRRGVAIAEGSALRYLRLHTALGPTFLGCLIAVAYWRTSFWISGSAPSLLYVVVCGLLVVLMTVQGYIGGELVYRYGVAVERHFKRLPLHEP